MDQGPKSYFAEFLGTFALCFLGQGAIVVQHLLHPGAIDWLAVAAAHGVILAVMTSALGAVSGGHFNPAVTFGFVTTGRQSWTSAITYWVSQLFGAVVANAMLRTAVPGADGVAVRYGAPVFATSTGSWQAFLLEFVLTFLLVTVFWGTMVEERAPRLGGFGIGFALFAAMLVCGPLTGAALNPARDFGAAFVAGVWQGHWIHWLAPLLGGGAAARLYKSVVMRPQGR